MKQIVLTSIVALALGACSDTPEAQLDDAYTGGGEDAVELVEGVPAGPDTPADTLPFESTPIGEDTQPGADEPEGEIMPPVETAAPVGDGVMEESDLDAAKEIVGDNPADLIESALPEVTGDVKAPEVTLDPVDLPDTEDLSEQAAGALEDKAEEPAEDSEDTETPQ